MFNNMSSSLPVFFFLGGGEAGGMKMTFRLSAFANDGVDEGLLLLK